jgi:hypothetical protein
MDFSLIKQHPWETAGIVLGGGVLLYIVLHRGSGNSSQGAATAPTYAASGGVDPQTAQLQLQAQVAQSQASTYLAGLQLQGATQISLAQIGADVTKSGYAYQGAAVDQQTSAQLALGIASLNAQTQQTQIDATLQTHYIDAIVAAFNGRNNTVATPTQTPTPVTQPTIPGGSSQVPPVITTYVPTPSGTGGSDPVNVGSTNPGTVPPGGSLLIPYPHYENCDPRDVACVARNQATNINWENADIAQNNANIHSQCLANAAMNLGKPNYAALVAACG